MKNLPRGRFFHIAQKTAARQIFTVAAVFCLRSIFYVNLRSGYHLFLSV